MQKENMSQKREVNILRELGIPEYQISYIVHQKYKNEVRERWR
jgi:hypothetical protein